MNTLAMGNLRLVLVCYRGLWKNSLSKIIGLVLVILGNCEKEELPEFVHFR
jgi:hypothetical protein